MTRLDRILSMELGEMADFLLRVGDFEPRGIDFCRNLPECTEAVDAVPADGDESELPCRECMAAWLQEELEENAECECMMLKL